MDSNKKYWKGLEELEQTPAFVESKKGEFAETLPVEDLLEKDGLKAKTPRRDFLKALGFGVGAVTLAACNRAPVHKSVPYLIKPEEVTPGVANYYASSYKGQSILVKTREGRPIFIEPNPNGLFGNSGTNPASQASVLDLYDMSKLKGPKRIKGDEISWDTVDKEVIAALDQAAAAGKQIRLVSASINSPSALAAIQDFIAKYPTAQLVQYDPVSYSGIIKANEMSFGKAGIPQYRFDKADLVVSVGADFLSTWIDDVEFTKQYMSKRDYKTLKGGKMSRHVQFESGLSVTGSNADVRVAVKPSEQGPALIALYNVLTGSSLPNALADNAKAMTAIKLVAQELNASKGRALVVSGSNDISTQVIVNAINSHLGSYGNTINLGSTNNVYKGDDLAFAQFLNEAKAGSVGVAIFIDANPIYEYFDSKAVEEALAKIAFKVSLADREDETASYSTLVAPASHYLESWGDAEAQTGYFTVVQPTINPVFNTRQFEQSILTWTGNTTSYHDYVQRYWDQNILAGTGKAWKDVLQEGYIFKGSETPSGGTFAGDLGAAAQEIGKISKALAKDVEVQLYQSAGVGDGKHANNAYLQELPDPISKVTWENYAAINPKFAKSLGLEETDLVEVKGNNGYAIVLPVLFQPGQAVGTVSIAVGYGRTQAGKAGNEAGKNAYPLASLNNGTLLFASTATLSKAGGPYVLAQTQTHHTIEGRNIIRETNFANYLEDPAHGSGNHGKKHKTYDLWNKYEQPGHNWVMAIDLNACTGCGACIVACSIENNVPVVGKDEVRRRREMHWIRIDRYYSFEQEGEAVTEESEIKHLDDLENVTVIHQPMLCQHCDHAPCETVCPVLATVHSSEGLNHMAYNRCFGTRYCANNCPYKVRRFNWFNYWNDSRFDNYLNNEFTQLVLNPDVTSRSRGVMEKCTMCLQRIQAGKLQAKKDKRKVKDGDIKVACQVACSANAIIFGDANDPESEVSKALKNERVYYVLEELNVQPGVGYMTKVRNTFDA